MFKPGVRTGPGLEMLTLFKQSGGSIVDLNGRN